jgi:hypothetical protein
MESNESLPGVKKSPCLCMTNQGDSEGQSRSKVSTNDSSLLSTILPPFLLTSIFLLAIESGRQLNRCSQRLSNSAFDSIGSILPTSTSRLGCTRDPTTRASPDVQRTAPCSPRGTNLYRLVSFIPSSGSVSLSRDWKRPSESALSKIRSQLLLDSSQTRTAANISVPFRSTSPGPFKCYDMSWNDNDSRAFSSPNTELPPIPPSNTHLSPYR